MLSFLVHFLVKNCTEVIDLGFSSYTIHHTVYDIPFHSTTMTIGRGAHDLSILPVKNYLRLYNYSYDLFPTRLNRDANDPRALPIDAYLITELEH